MKYDIITYFPFIHTSSVHKYFNLNRRLNEICDSLMLLDNSKFGLQGDVFNMFSDYHHNMKSVSKDEVKSILDSYQYKLYLTGCNNRKNYIDSEDISIASKKAKVIQIWELFDLYGYGANITMLPSNYWDDIYSDRGLGEKKYVNSFLWDDIDDCLPNKLSKDDFYEKYNLDKSKPFYVWLPDSIQCQNNGAQIAYRSVCDLDNVIIKLHPNELRRHKADRVNYQWSYELYSNKKHPILDSLDTHWCYKYMECALVHQSTIGIELGVYKKPCLYVDVDNNENQLFNDFGKGVWKNKYCWAGTSCKSDEVKDFIDNKKYVISNDDYDNHLNKVLTDSKKDSVDLICKTIGEML